jgi:hypothetical protein
MQNFSNRLFSGQKIIREKKNLKIRGKINKAVILSPPFKVESANYIPGGSSRIALWHLGERSADGEDSLWSSYKLNGENNILKQ